MDTVTEQLANALGRIEELTQEKYALEDAVRRCRHGMEAVNGLEVIDGAAPDDSFKVDLSLEIAACEAVLPGPHGASKWMLVVREVWESDRARIRDAQMFRAIEENGLCVTSPIRGHECLTMWEVDIRDENGLAHTIGSGATLSEATLDAMAMLDAEFEE